MTELRTRIVVDLAGNLVRRARQYQDSLSGFAQRGQRELGMMRRSTAALGAGIDRLGNRYIALATGAGAVGTLRYLAGLETRFVRLRNQTRSAADDMARLKREIYEVAQSPDIRVDPGQILAAIEKIVEQTGDLKLAGDNIRNIGLALQGTGAEGAYVGALISQLFQKFDIKGADQMLATLDVLTKQGKQGAFTLENLATQGERVTAAYGAMGRKGPEVVREMGAILQMVRQSTGSAEMAATAFEALVRTITQDKVKELEKVGVKIFDPEKLKEGVKAYRALPDIIEDIVRRSGGDAQKLGAIFDAEAMRALNAFVINFKPTGNFDGFRKFLDVAGDGSELLRDSAAAAATFDGALQSLYTVWKKFADENLSGPVQALADALNSLDPKTLNTIMGGLAVAGAAGGAFIVGRKLQLAGRKIGGWMGAGKGGKPGAGDTPGGAAGFGVTPVRVVNWPMALSRTAGYASGRAGAAGVAAGATAGGAAGAVSRLAARGAGWLGRLGRGAAWLPGVALAGMDLLSTWTASGGTAATRARGTASALGGAGGAVAGAKAGAALGMLGGPLAWATVPAGGLVGGTAGYLAGEYGGGHLGGWLAELLDLEGAREPDEPTRVELDVRIDSEGRPAVRDMRQYGPRRVDLETDLGYVMGTP